jgi:hypothetical protein
MKTEDGFEMFYEETYYLVYFKNHSIVINTEQERKLYHPYECVIHLGASINTFGLKIFKNKANAKKYCNKNKKK